jgi:hypothetical protein
VSGHAEAHAGHAWLPAVLPARSHRLLVSDPVLAEELRDAGAELVERGADVEIGPPEKLPGQAPLATFPIDNPVSDVRSFAGRAASRLRAVTHVRIAAVRAQRGLRRLGYRETEVFAWDLGHPLALGDKRRQISVAERLPRRAVVIGRNGPRKATLLEAAVEDAAGTVGLPLRLDWASARAGPTTAALDGGLLRIAVGPARGQLDRQAAAQAILREARLPRDTAGLIAWVEARGRTGLGDWSLERRLPGGAPPPVFSEQLLAECVDFLVVLHGADKPTAPARTARATAETTAAFCAQAEGRALVAIGERLDSTLADVPRGFAHGDYFRGNLLVEDRRLVGIVDWDASGPGRLPLLDLLHLRHMNEHRPADLDWGPSLVEHLLPWARGGGDEIAHEYCRRVGIEPLPERLEALVAAYWLERLAYQLSTYADRATRPRWLARNIADVLAAFAPRFLA